jgi:hypothetical protein
MVPLDDKAVVRLKARLRALGAQGPVWCVSRPHLFVLFVHQILYPVNVAQLHLSLFLSFLMLRFSCNATLNSEYHHFHLLD